MLRMPKEISKAIKTIEDSGFSAFIVGGSIRDMLLGSEPEDWDLATDAPPEKIASLFKTQKPRGEKFGVVNIVVDTLEIEVAALRTEEGYSDFRHPDKIEFTDDVNADLSRRDFTVNAIAYNPQKGLIDPFAGQKDLKEKLLRTVGEADERFKQDPLRMLRGIRLVGQLGFDLQIDTFRAMVENSSLLKEVSQDRKRVEFEKTLISKEAGKALRISTSSNILAALVGDCYPPKGRMDNGNLEVLIQNIDRSRRDVDLRLALLLLCFEKNKALHLIDKMNLSKERSRMQKAAQNLLMDLYFATDKYAIKRFIYLNGEDVYNFLTDLCKQQRDVYDTPGYRIESRYYLLDDIKKNKEPIYIEDLAVSGKDLIEAGIAQGEKVGEMLKMLIDVAHRFPGLNTKPKLLKKAKSLKNPLRAKFRNYYFVK